MNTLIDKAERLAIKEIEKYGSPHFELYKISKRQVLRLSKKYEADTEVCLLGSILADFKIGIAIKQNRIAEHIQMSANATRKFLEKEKINEDLIEKVIHCIEAHHGSIPYKSLEAEIVANADCYRFLTFRGVFAFIENLAKENRFDLDGIINYIEQKVDEKWNAVSLPDVKKELSPNYKLIKQIVKKARVN